jgi:NAD(P)-dependent dehydrogenase (short-subunit alcohol dehydrogenase family)
MTELDGLNFAGQVALVTGGSGGIGAAICRALTASGAAVAVGYGSGTDAARALVAALAPGSKSPVEAFGADLEDPGAPERLVGDVQQALGPIEILVAKAFTASRTFLRAERHAMVSRSTRSLPDSWKPRCSLDRLQSLGAASRSGGSGARKRSPT